jgi:hypothetical protein
LFHAEAERFLWNVGHPEILSHGVPNSTGFAAGRASVAALICRVACSHVADERVSGLSGWAERQSMRRAIAHRHTSHKSEQV